MTSAAELTQTTRKFNLCRHTHGSGRRCGSPALRGEQFCYYHHPSRRPGPLANRSAILRELNRLIPAIIDGSISPDRATLLLQLIQLAYRNLPR